jgi:hypothetical protein
MTVKHSDIEEHRGIKVGDTVEVRAESGMPGEREPRIEKVRRIMLTEATPEEMRRLHIPAKEITWDFESGKMAGHYDKVRKVVDPQLFQDLFNARTSESVEASVEALLRAYTDPFNALRVVFTEAIHRNQKSDAEVAELRRTLSQLNGMYEKIMVPLRKECRVTQDESPWGCLDRLLDELKTLRGEVVLLYAALGRVSPEVPKTEPTRGRALYDAVQLRLSRGHYEGCGYAVSAGAGDCDCGHQAMIDALKGD